MTLSLDSVLPNRIPRSRRTSIIGGYPSVPHIRISRASSVNAPCPRVTLNIGGKRFTTLWSTLHRFTGTKLSRLNESDPHYDAINNEYFFDRNPANFDYILDYYRNQELHFPHCVCGPSLKKELDFWQLDEDNIAPCCWRSYKAFDEEQRRSRLIENYIDPKEPSQFAEDNKTLAEYRRKIWTFLEMPGSSKGALIWAVIFVILIIISIVVLIAETHPWFRVPLNKPGSRRNIDNTTNVKLILFLTTELHPAILHLDGICTLFFALELLMRFFTCPNKVTFVKTGYNILDILCVLPMFVSYVIQLTDTSLLSNDETFILFAYLSLTSTFRVFRLLKIAKHFVGFRVLVLAIRSSLKELLLLFLLIFIGMLFFSVLIYFAEFSEDGSFEHIPIGFWWAIVTMTTVGYGDKVPKTGWGYMVGGLCAITGMLCTSLPIPIIANNFNMYYSYAIKKKEQRERKQLLAEKNTTVEEDKPSSTSSTTKIQAFS